MLYNYRCTQLPLSALSDQTHWDIQPFLSPDQPVLQSVASITNTGLLHPILVQELKDKSYEIVTGSRSLNIYRTTHSPENIYCRVLAEDVPTSAILTYLYEEYSTNRNLSSIELAYFFQLCKQHLDSNEQANLFSALRIQTKPHAITRTLELLSLHHDAQSAIMSGVIAENMARELLKVSEKDRKTLLNLFAQLRLGGGKQKRLLIFLRDLAGRKAVSIEEVIDQPEIREILDHPDMNTPQKTQNLLQHLQSSHSPSLAHAEKTFRTWTNQFQLPAKCDLEHSQSFEQDTVTLNVTFSNREQFEERWEKIRKAIE